MTNSVITGIVATFDRDNIDTDQINGRNVKRIAKITWFLIKVI